MRAVALVAEFLRRVRGLLALIHVMNESKKLVLEVGSNGILGALNKDSVHLTEDAQIHRGSAQSVGCQPNLLGTALTSLMFSAALVKRLQLFQFFQTVIALVIVSIKNCLELLTYGVQDTPRVAGYF